PKHPRFAASYTHDVAAQVTAAETANPGSGSPAVTNESYGYDDLGRLTSYSTTDPPSALPQRYAYDATGRMTRSPAGGDHRYDDSAHPHAVTSTSAGHTRSHD